MGKVKGTRTMARERDAKVLALHEEGRGASDLARWLGTSTSHVYKMIKRAKEARGLEVQQ